MDAPQVNVNVDSGNGFTNKEMLIRLDQKLDSVVEKVTKVTDDHETRLRLLERFRNSVPGIAVFSLLVSSATVVLTVLHV